MCAVSWFGLFLAFPTLAYAQSKTPPNEGTLIKQDQNDWLVDLGKNQGAKPGVHLELWRTIKVKHPVTGKLLTDRFFLGNVELIQVRNTLSLVRPLGTMSRQPSVGDVVLMPVAKTTVPTDPSTQHKEDTKKGPSTLSPPPSSAPATSEEVSELNHLLTALKGASLEDRISKYQDYVDNHPQSQYRTVLLEEIAIFKSLLGDVKAPSSPRIWRIRSPIQAEPNRALRIGVEVSDETRGVVIHLRSQDEAAYTTFTMTSNGPGYFGVTIPGSRVHGSKLEYFIEGTGPYGKAHLLKGTASNPLELEIHNIQLGKPPSQTLSQVSLWSDFASYNSKKLNDFVWQTEGTLGTRFNDVGIRALRSGFGVFRGKGGTLQELDVLNRNPRSVGLTYGYLELELAFAHQYSIIGRGIVGLQDDGLNGGAQLFFRIGNDQETNLSIGGEILGGIGVRGITQLEWNTLPRFPIIFRTEVTNQPAGFTANTTPPPPSTPGSIVNNESQEASGKGEIGVRAIVQAGYKFTPNLVVSVRGSFQGRTINHSGPGGGLALNYQW
jgi:hypothetical protein